MCPRDTTCSLHVKLERLKQYVEWLHEKNLNDNIIVKKICLVFNKEVAQIKEVFWWNDTLE